MKTLCTWGYETRQDIHIMTLQGALRVGGILPFLREFQTLLGRGAAEFIIDLEQLNQIDSSGLSALLTIFKRTTQAGGTIKFVGVTGQTREIFRLLRLNSVLNVYADREAAMKSFHKERARQHHALPDTTKKTPRHKLRFTFPILLPARTP